LLRRSLLWKLLGINVLIIGFVIVIVWLAVNHLAAGYFMVLMERYNISPTASHQMFVDSVHRYLTWASLGGLLLAAVFSFLLMNRVLGPLKQMTRITGRIASGDYSGQVPFTSNDEVGQLADAFNRMTESLQRIERLRKTMVIDVAHELRTPLTNIRGYLEALTDGVVPATAETFRSLQEETMRLVRLVEDILLLAKAEAARGRLQKTEIKVKELILRVLESFVPQFRAKKIAVETDFGEGTHRVEADPEKLTQVITNILQNAWEYTPIQGRFRIVSKLEPSEIMFLFANTSSEVDEKDLPLLFERFYRGEKSRSREHGGAGIGLTIVKELIDAHGGRVGADLSLNEIRIWFSLPI
jgi:two-component system, OmpR family, sensor histidine kinase BaeS